MADMTTSAAEVAAAIDEDLANLRDPRARAGIMAFRVVPPAPIRLAWDYGQPGETFGGWLVFSGPRRRTGSHIVVSTTSHTEKNVSGLTLVMLRCAEPHSPSGG